MWFTVPQELQANTKNYSKIIYKIKITTAPLPSAEKWKCIRNKTKKKLYTKRI